MTTTPLLSGTFFNGTVARVRADHATIRECLRRMTCDPEPAPQTRLALINKMAMALLDCEAATNDLERIGREAKTLRKETQA